MSDADRQSFRVRVIPRAKRDEVAGERAGALLVRVAAPPESGRANDAVRRLIASELGVRAGAVRIVSGSRSRDKRVAVEGADAPLRDLLASHGVDPAD